MHSQIYLLPTLICFAPYIICCKYKILNIFRAHLFMKGTADTDLVVTTYGGTCVAKQTTFSLL